MAKEDPTYLVRFAPAGLVASLPRRTVIEAFGSGCVPDGITYGNSRPCPSNSTLNPS